LARNNFSTLASKNSPFKLNIKDIYPEFENSGKFYINPTLNICGTKIELFFRETNVAILPKSDNRGNMERVQIGPSLTNATYRGILNDDGKITQQEKVIGEEPSESLEDVRVISFGKLNLFIGTEVRNSSDKSPPAWRTRVAIRVDGKNFPLLSPTGKNFEKNWVPILLEENTIFLLHSNNPTKLIEFDLLDKSQSVYEVKDLCASLSLSGGSQFVSLPDSSYIRIARRRFPLFNRGYIHISFIVLHNSNFQETAVSTPFIFQDLGFEICNGLALNQENEFVFSWGENDMKMFVGISDYDETIRWVKNNQFGLKRNSNLFSILGKMIRIRRSL
jgi:hypothetical protein